MDLAFVQAVAVLVDEEGDIGAFAKVAVPALRVISQHSARRGMKRHQAGFPELCASNGEHSLSLVHVVITEVNRLAQSQACNGQQSEQAMIGPASQRVDRAARHGGFE